MGQAFPTKTNVLKRAGIGEVAGTAATRWSIGVAALLVPGIERVF